MKAYKAYLYDYKYVTIIVFKEVHEAKIEYSGLIYNGIDTVCLFRCMLRKEAKKIRKKFIKYLAKRDKYGNSWWGDLNEMKEIIKKFYSEVYYT